MKVRVLLTLEGGGGLANRRLRVVELQQKKDLSRRRRFARAPGSGGDS
jgi:hypothetical protein